MKPAPAVQQASFVPLVAAVQAPTALPDYRRSDNIAADIARWNSLRQSDSLPFSAYASFLTSHRGWPGESAMRRAAERQIDPNVNSTAEVIRYFAMHPPLTATGHARFASALLAEGRLEEARTAARTAWRTGVLPTTDEERILGQFGAALTREDHDVRMDVLLSNGATTSARRILPLASPERQPLYEARMALQANSSEAPGRVQALGAAFAGDPGLLMDRANYMRSNGNPLGARQLMAQRRSLANLPADPKKFMEAQLLMARGAANDSQWQMAYQIAAQLDDLYPAGTDISQKSFGERDDFTSLAWLAGTAALQRLGRPAEAIGLFERYARAAQSPQTQTKGLYWAGRAAQAAGQQDRARQLYAEAGRHFDQFYGQLALERIGQPLPAPNTQGPPPPSAAERQAFANNSLVQAVRYLGQNAGWRDQSEFVRALAASVKSDQERTLAVALGQEIGRPDLGVLVARQARSDGSFDYKRWGFPEIRVPAAQAQHWTMVHAITRQESLFDREAVSHAGARGYMQLMPGTAREVATRLGLPYEQARLTRDTDYNVMLGSTYFAGLLNQWGGSYPLAVASYNAGPGNVRRWVRENGDPRTPGVDMIEWIEAIPFFETRNYVQRVLENAVVYDLMHPNRSATQGNQRLSFYLGSRERPLLAQAAE
ncbi:MAG: lytic transglycosylase domain-containing protein [Allosphingosinicella sp.]|uniref:lytic transglycosylase domain-containing protein n=1 Tax=Allosphingosinicella sp. TaxID=2823234 RepID=UPI003936FFD9